MLNPTFSEVSDVVFVKLSYFGFHIDSSHSLIESVRASLTPGKQTKNMSYKMKKKNYLKQAATFFVFK